MTIDRIHQEIKFRYNRLNSNHKKDFSKGYLDDAINKVQDDFVEMIYSGNVPPQYRFGFEINQQKTDMLLPFVKTIDIVPTLVQNNLYKVSISAIPKYRHFLRGITDPCQSNIDIIRLNDLDVKLKNDNTKPSSKWKRVLGVFKDNYLWLYTGQPITNVSIDYLCSPKPVFSGGYNTLEYDKGDLTAYNSVSPLQTSDINPSFHDILVDMVVQYLAFVVEGQTTENILINKL